MSGCYIITVVALWAESVNSNNYVFSTLIVLPEQIKTVLGRKSLGFLISVHATPVTLIGWVDQPWYFTSCFCIVVTQVLISTLRAADHPL